MKCLKCQSTDFKIKDADFNIELDIKITSPAYVCKCGEALMDTGQMNVLMRKYKDEIDKTAKK